MKIIIKASKGFFKPKKSSDHRPLKTNWAPKWYSAVLPHLCFLPKYQTLPKAIPISVYKSVHTGAKSQLGGEKKGLDSPLYHVGIASLVTILEKNPTPKEIIIPRRDAI